MSAKNKLLRRLQALYAFRDKSGGASTTVALAAAAGATTFTVASAAGIAAGKSLRIDDGENIERVEVSGVAGSVVTVVKPLLRAHAAGFAVVEQTGYDLGDVKGNITPTQATESTDVLSAMRRLVFTKLQGFQTFSIETAVYGLTPENLAVALGIPLTAVAGAGTSITAPKVLATDFNDVDSENNVCVLMTYVQQDGSVKTREFWGCAADYSGYSINLAIGQDGVVPIKFAVYGAGVEMDGAPTFTASTTIRAGKGKVFGELTNVGLWTAGGGDTTVGTAAAAGATTLIVADATGITTPGWIGVGTDDVFETHYVASKAVNTLTLATPLLRAQAIGVVVQKITQLQFAAIGKDGVKFNVGGTTTPIQSGLRRLPLGMQPGTVDVSVAFSLLELTLVNLAYVLGIPQSEIANSRLLLSEKIGQATILGVFAQGLLKDGTVCLLNIWGAAQDVTSVATQFGDPNGSALPFAAKPSSGIQLVQYAA
jgi:hypothetical protein